MEYNGFEITVTNHGMFECKFAEDITLSCETLRQLQAKIDERSKEQRRHLALPVISWESKKGATPKIIKGVLTGVNRTTRFLKIDGIPDPDSIHHVLADTDANAALLTDYLAAKSAFDALDDRVRKASISGLGYGRIDIGQYDNILQQVEAMHSRSAKNGETIAATGESQ